MNDKPETDNETEETQTFDWVDEAKRAFRGRREEPSNDEREER